MAFIMLDQFVEPDLERVAEAIRTRHPDTSITVGPTPSGQGAKPNMLVCDNKMVVVMSLPAPLPRDEGAIKRAARTWPQAAQVFERHQAHLIVSNLGPDEENQLPNARILTAVIGGLIAAVPGCSGIVCNQVPRPADHWLDMSRSAFAPYPDYPFLLWVDIHPFRYDSAIGAVTSGLASFVGREIELEGGGLDLSSVLNKMAGLSVYLIERGSVIPDGDTFGASEEEYLQVRHTSSTRFPGLPVLLAAPPVKH
jgi:hypothetical protein